MYQECVIFCGSNIEIETSLANVLKTEQVAQAKGIVIADRPACGGTVPTGTVELTLPSTRPPARNCPAGKSQGMHERPANGIEVAWRAS
jgi:hypothetical protein